MIPPQFNSAEAILRYAHERFYKRAVYPLIQEIFPRKALHDWRTWQADKGIIGQAVDQALGVSTNGAEIDFPSLGIEVKTLPLTKKFLPAESTFIASAPLIPTLQGRWEESLVYRKIQCVLWIPFFKPGAENFREVQFACPFLWQPCQSIQNALKRDWEELHYAIISGYSAQISSSVGEYIQLRPKGKNRQMLSWGLDQFGEKERTRPKAYYFRRTATAALLHDPLKHGQYHQI